MATREHFLARLLELPRVQSKDVRRGIFRQSIAALGMGDQNRAPLALAGVDPKALARSIQIAQSDGLFNDLDFLAPSPVSVALYQIAAALPLGAERRVIGRKVLTYLYQGNAETFCTLASRMALGSTRPLSGAGVRARVSIATSLRNNADSACDRMALAFVTRRELAHDWVNANATGSLPDRRLAGRLMERAAREAVKRVESGDVYPLRAFHAVATGGGLIPRHETVAPAWHALLADRETLVWRHVAVARGLLSTVLPPLADEIKDGLRPNLSPTEWRRAATSLVSRIAVNREAGLRDAMLLLDGPLLQHDPGIAMAMVWGLAPVAEVEPEAAEELVEAIAAAMPISIADSLVELRGQVRGFGAQAAEICARSLRQSLGEPELDDGLSALARSILDDLEGEETSSFATAVNAALEAFGEEGTVAAHALAEQALALASERVAELESLEVDYHGGVGTAAPRRRAMTLLRDIDTALLE
ncbi:MAG: hypothetical protein KC731_39955 [Myxococcales bacterium]|nr:hypothetical protein [Myxococcales bacterium]